jgi:hypothetical protein
MTKILTPSGWKTVIAESAETQVKTESVEPKGESFDLNNIAQYVIENEMLEVVYDFLDSIEEATNPKNDRSWLDAAKAAEKEDKKATKGDKPAHWMTSGKMVKDIIAKGSERSNLSKAYADFFKKGGQVTLVKGRKMRKEEFEISIDALVEFVLLNCPTIVEEYIKESEV